MRCVLLYQDELTYYRCPTVYCDYTMAGSDVPRAAQGTGYNTSRRIAGCLDAYTWKDLQERVEQWLIQYDRPSPDLLRYVGLLPD